MAFDEDLSVFFDLDGFAVRATWGAYTSNVIYSEPTEDLFDGVATGTDYTVELPTSDFPGIKRGDTISIDGKGQFFLVQSPTMLHDGALKQLKLGKT